METLKQRADNEHCAQLAGTVLDPPGDVDDPLPGGASDMNVPDGETLPGQNAAEIRAIADIGAQACMR
jgi:hypothetical protein